MFGFRRFVLMMAKNEMSAVCFAPEFCGLGVCPDDTTSRRSLRLPRGRERRSSRIATCRRRGNVIQAQEWN